MGGGNCLFGTEITEDRTVPLFRGNVSVVEVKSVDTNPTKLPDVEPLQAGKIDTTITRCFDLLCVGKYEQGSNLKLNIQPTDEIPNLVTKNANRDPVFAEPRPMCTIQAPKGHNVWIKIDLQIVTTNASDYMCLGIKKQGEDDYFDVLYASNAVGYVDILENDTVELIPLVSSTKLSEKYTATKVGESAKITDMEAYDFGAVYRVHVSLHNSQWVKEQSCGLGDIVVSSEWDNEGRIGIGSVMDQNGTIHEDQLYAINAADGTLVYSSDGIHWFANGSVGDKDWFGAMAYGNEIWCNVNWRGTTYGVRRSLDYGKTWSDTLENMVADRVDFANGIFLVVQHVGEAVYTSSDAETWTQVGNTRGSGTATRSFLVYGDGKWICSTEKGYLYQSKDGKGEWTSLGNGLVQINVGNWYGGCYANGYFYAIGSPIGGTLSVIARSADGVKWTPVISLSYRCENITFYKNKLWAFSEDGKKCAIGLFNPDGTIDIES